MNCDEFEDRWNEVLDARSTGLPEVERLLEAHASTCEQCQATSARYERLRQAVLAWGPAPVPSADSIERLRRLSVPPRSRRLAGRWVRFAIPLAAAAAVLILIRFAGPWRTNPPVPDRIETAPIARVAPPRPIEAALEQATSATIDLALEASAPAARIGRDVLGYDSAEVEVVPIESDEPTPVATADLLQSVGERVKPISGSARHAFSFLLGPPPGPERRPANIGESTH